MMVEAIVLRGALVKGAKADMVTQELRLTVTARLTPETFAMRGRLALLAVDKRPVDVRIGGEAQAELPGMMADWVRDGVTSASLSYGGRTVTVGGGGPGGADPETGEVAGEVAADAGARAD